MTTLRDQVLALKRANPDMKAQAIADKLGTSANYVSGILWRLRKDGELPAYQSKAAAAKAAEKAAKKAAKAVPASDKKEVRFDIESASDALMEKWKSVQQAIKGRTSALDTQVDGDHYKKLKIQPMEYSMANNLDACQHTVIKYVTRFRDKGGITDLEKAKHVLDMLIEMEKRGA